MGKSATTLSLVKLVEMPDGRQSVFISNIGDSRIYLMRRGKLTRITEDDSVLTYAVSENTMTKEQANQIDQANSPSDIPDRWRSYYRLRNQVTNSVGGHGLKTVEVRRFIVEKGDKIILASDGLTDQLKETEIESLLNENKNPREVERVLQKSAEKMSLDGTLPRSKGDDIAVIVHQIEERGPSRAKEPAELKQEKITKVQVESWRTEAVRLRQEITSAREQMKDFDTSTKEGLGSLIVLREKEQNLSIYDHWIARAVVQEIEDGIPPRFDDGQAVQVFRNDMSPPSYDRVVWIVANFDPKNDRYILTHPSAKKHIFVERYTLELWQKANLVEAGDTIDGFHVDGKTTDGKIALTKKSTQQIVRRIETSQEVEKMLRDQMQKARAAKKEMTRSLERARDLKKEIEDLTERKVKLLAK
jgi:serine/threonine protein phosphatase PrpC